MENIGILQNINSTSFNNLTFYIYVHNNNDLSFNNSLSFDFSTNSNNIYNIIQNTGTNKNKINKYFTDNSNSIFYDYGNLMFILDNSAIMQDLFIDNIYIPDINKLTKNYTDISNFSSVNLDTTFTISHTNNVESSIISFKSFNLINLLDMSYVDLSNIQKNKKKFMISE